MPAFYPCIEMNDGIAPCFFERVPEGKSNSIFNFREKDIARSVGYARTFCHVCATYHALSALILFVFNLTSVLTSTLRDRLVEVELAMHVYMCTREMGGGRQIFEVELQYITKNPKVNERPSAHFFARYIRHCRIQGHAEYASTDSSSPFVAACSVSSVPSKWPSGNISIKSHLL